MSDSLHRFGSWLWSPTDPFSLGLWRIGYGLILCLEEATL
jgi:hypothetical protein